MGVGRDPPSESPTREDARIEVLVLGTYHMDNPGLDAINIESDDILKPTRQRELSELADRLSEWHPDLVAVERPAARQDEVESLYGRYRTNELSYDQEVELEAIHPEREGAFTECRSEVIQIGFRLADRLDQNRVHAVDYPMTLAADFDEEELAELAVDFGHMQQQARSAIDVELPNAQQHKQRCEKHLAESTVLEHHRFLNREEQLAFNHTLMFAGCLAGSDERYVGARMLGSWYERNLRIVENLWRVTDEETERILLPMGNGHVRILRHLLTEAPMFTPVPALPLLED